MFSRGNIKRWLFALSIVLLLSVTATTGATSSMFNDLEPSTDDVLRAIAPWYDLAWYYRKSLTINNSSGGALTDYQVQFSINTQELIGAGKMQATGADIRFTQLNDGTTLPYWIQSGINTASTVIWVKVPSVPIGSSTIYIYYGNPGASAVSSIPNTFPAGSFQDLFNDISRVDGSASQQVTVSGGQAELTIGTSEIEDQVQTSGALDYSIWDLNWSGQTFTVGFSGTMSKVTIKASKTGSPPNALTVELRNVVSDLPGSTVYASASRSDITTAAEYDFTFATPPSVAAGTKYSIVVYTVGGTNSNRYNISYVGSDVYGGGRKCDSSNGGGSWAGTAYELYFKTYVNTGWDLDQSQTGSTNSRQVYGNNWRAQSFLAGLTGKLRQITLNMARTGSPPSAVTVEVRNVEEVSGEILDQSQTSFSGDRQAYGNNWWAQTFRAGSTGDLTKATLRASKTGSPLTALIVELRNVVVGYQQTLDQSQTSYSGDRQVYGSNWLAQIFQAGLSGDLGKVTLRASKTGTPPNALTVELRNAVQVQEENLDQSQATQIASFKVYGNRWVAQTFTAGSSGTLSKVTIWASKTGSPNPLTVELRNATAGDLPGSTVYASASRSDITTAAAYDFTFASPPSVTAGVKYSIVVYTSGGNNPNRYDVGYNTSDVYANGRKCESYDAGSSWSGTTTDLYFRTYVTVTDYAPGSTVYATASRSDISTAGEYEFTFGTPYSIASGTKYALVIYTSLGDASNYYGVSYQGSDVYGNGRELSSVNAGSNWTGSATDLYFKTYIVTAVGDQPGTTVYASASRGDITAAADYDFVFATPYAVSAESNYALVIYTSGGDASNYYNISYQASDAYALGKEALSTDGGSNWTPNNSADLYFKTYVTVAAGYKPGTTVYASASRSDIGTTASKVEFVFSSPPSVTASTRYAIVVKTTGGDASNYYQVYYQGSDIYANGNESYSVDAGTNWSITSYDLWFKVYVDQPTSGTLRSVTIPENSATRIAVGIQFSWNDTEPVDTDIKHQLEYYNGAWALIPDGDLAGNSTGFDTSPVDVSSLIITYGQIRLRANLSTSDSTSVPSIQDWTITYYYRGYTSPEPGVTLIGAEE